MNPYRTAFYQRQAEWHRYEGAEHVRRSHETRAAYYDWYTRGWLPPDREARVLDIGCGSGQFLHFLAGRGYRNAVGVDLDTRQVGIARELGLQAVESSVFDFLETAAGRGGYDVVAMLDIIEHFTREELFGLMETVVRALKPGGRLIASVPNAESPVGLQCAFADITHEMTFTPLSFDELLFCHGLKLAELRDPWPAPVGWKRAVYRRIVGGTRRLESLRLRALGLEPPRIWSNVMWALAVKPGGG